MGYQKKEVKYNVLAIVIFLAATVVDIILVQVLKERSSMHRWLWLPLISLGLACVAAGGLSMPDEDSFTGTALGCLAIIWGVIRGIIVVVAYFKALSGFWAIAGAVFLCLFMFILNAFPFIMSGGIAMGNNESTSKSSTPKTYRKSSSDRPAYRDDKIVKASSRPQQGNLANYFSSSFCSPQVGTLYFWHSYPSMSSSFGSHSNYTIKGTLGIKKQSVEAFHVTSSDMYSYLNSVQRDVEDYVDEMICQYRRDYPDDETDFRVNVDLSVTVVD